MPPFAESNLCEKTIFNWASILQYKYKSPPFKAHKNSNEMDQFGASPDFEKAMTKAVVDAFKSDRSMSEQVLKKASVKEGLGELLLWMAYEGFKSKSTNNRGG